MTQLDQVIQGNASLLPMVLAHGADRQIRPVTAEHDHGNPLILELAQQVFVS